MPDSIITKDGQAQVVDIIVFATGFEAADLNLYTKILGIKGTNLIDEWSKTGAEAFHGTTVAGYPNLALLLGPNTGLGHNSMIYMIEAQANFILDCINLMNRKGLQTVEVKASVLEKFNRDLDRQAEGTVWNSGCNSWYLNANGRSAAVWPDFTYKFRFQSSSSSELL